jgi:ribonuclease D
MRFFYYKYDLPDDLLLEGDIAVDCEAMGLNIIRDRLCAVQISNGNNTAHVIHFPDNNYSAPNLKRLLTNSQRTKIFHFGRFDIAIIYHYMKIELKNIFCTKIASRLCRTYTDSHSLRELCSELLNVKISKQQQCSDWGAPDLTQPQIEYAGSDVLHLHNLKSALTEKLIRERRLDLAQECFNFLTTRAKLDLLGWDNFDIFSY